MSRTLKPYFETKLGKLYHGSAIDILPKLPLIDFIITDPPYGMNNNVDSRRFSGGTEGHIAKRGNGGRFRKNIIGDDKPFDPRHLLNYPYVILWGSNHYLKYLPVGTTLVWIKRLDSAFGTFLSDAEIGWMNRGCGVYCKRDLSLLSNTRNRLHPNEKPVSLMVWCINKFYVFFKLNPPIVCDPYLGSGTTAIACERLNRKWIGIEISEEYCKIAVERIYKETRRLKSIITGKPVLTSAFKKQYKMKRLINI